MEGLTVSTVKVGFGGTHRFYSKASLLHKELVHKLQRVHCGIRVNVLKG